MRVNAKPRKKLVGVLLFVTLILFFCIELVFYPQSLPFALEMIQYLCLFAWVLWTVHFLSHYRLSYDIREDGVYILKGKKIYRYIPYDVITKVRIKSSTIYISTKGFWRIDEVLHPISDVNSLFDEIKSRIAAGKK